MSRQVPPSGSAAGRVLPRIGLALVALMFVVPFLLPNHRFPLTSYYAEWAALMLGVGALIVSTAHRGRSGFSVPWVAWVPLAFAGLVGAQAAFGLVPYAGQALVAIAYLVWASALIVLSASLVRELGAETVIRVLAWSLVVGGLLSALAGLIQHYHGTSGPVGFFVARKIGHEVHGNVAQRTHFANYTSLALISVAYLFSTSRLRGRFAVLLGIPLLFVFGLSGARIAWVFLLTALALAIVFWRAHRDSAEARRLVGCVGMMVVGFFLAQEAAFVAPLIPSGGGATTPTERLFAESTGPSERMQLWTEAWWAFLQAPAFGWGWGGFPAMHFDYQARHDSVAGYGAYHQAHNLILHLLAETGAAGAGLVTAGFVFWLWGVRRSAFSLERWWQLAVLGVLAVHSLSEFPLWYAYFLGVMAILLGFTGEHRAGGASTSPVRMVIAALSVLGGVFLVYDLDAYRDFERIFTSKEIGLNGNAEQGRLVARALSDPVLRPYGELAIAFSTAVEPARVQERLALVRRATRFAPYYPVVYKRAMLVAMAGEEKAAVREFERAMRVYPLELPSARRQLRELVERHPGKFEALLQVSIRERK